MDNNEIIRMAQDIDGHLNDHARGIDLSWETLAKIVQKGIDHEREACAKVCEEVGNEAEDAQPNKYFDIVAYECAAAIRARS